MVAAEHEHLLWAQSAFHSTLTLDARCAVQQDGKRAEEDASPRTLPCIAPTSIATAARAHTPTASGVQQVDRNHFQIRVHADGADACASSSRSMSCPTGQAPNEDACPPEGSSRAPMHVARDPRPHTFELESQPHTHERDPRSV